MRRFATAAVLAVPLFLAGGPEAGASFPPFGAPGVMNGPCSYGLGCGGRCLNLFPFLHQHGPLYNYGPYYGYPPFEPYGPWNAYLHYNPNYYGTGGGHGHHAKGTGNPHPLLGGHGGLFHGGKGGCGTCGTGHKGGGCHSCGSAAAAHVTSGSALDRYTGYGSPAASTAYYQGSIGLTPPAGVVPVAFYGN